MFKSIKCIYLQLTVSVLALWTLSRSSSFVASHTYTAPSSSAVTSISKWLVVQLPPNSQISEGSVIPRSIVEFFTPRITFLQAIDDGGLELPLLQVRVAFFPAFGVLGSTEIDTSDGLNCTCRFTLVLSGVSIASFLASHQYSTPLSLRFATITISDLE